MVYVDHEVCVQENFVHADREQRMLYEEGETVAAEGALPLPPPCCLLDLTLM